MKNTKKLKAVFRIAGIIALVAVIVFGIIACGGGDDPCTTCGNYPCTCTTACTHVFDRWVTINNDWHDGTNDVCKSGFQQAYCSNGTCNETNSDTRNQTPCKGTEGLILKTFAEYKIWYEGDIWNNDWSSDYGDDLVGWIVHGNYELTVEKVCIPDVHPVNGEPVVAIGAGAFVDLDDSWEGNETITSVRIGKNIIIIDDFAFADCEGLVTVTFTAGSQLETIGSNAFKQCAISNVEIPASIASISNDAFWCCENLTTVTVHAINPPTLGTYVFVDENDDPLANLVIKVPAGSVSAYKAANNWSEYADKITAITQ
jgi:hypothetical protein